MYRILSKRRVRQVLSGLHQWISLPSHRKTRIISHKYGVFAMSPKSMPIFSGVKTQKLANFLEILWDDSENLSRFSRFSRFKKHHPFASICVHSRPFAVPLGALGVLAVQHQQGGSVPASAKTKKTFAFFVIFAVQKITPSIRAHSRPFAVPLGVPGVLAVYTRMRASTPALSNSSTSSRAGIEPAAPGRVMQRAAAWLLIARARAGSPPRSSSARK